MDDNRAVRFHRQTYVKKPEQLTATENYVAASGPKFREFWLYSPFCVRRILYLNYYSVLSEF